MTACWVVRETIGSRPRIRFAATTWPQEARASITADWIPTTPHSAACTETDPDERQHVAQVVSVDRGACPGPFARAFAGEGCRWRSGSDLRGGRHGHHGF